MDNPIQPRNSIPTELKLRLRHKWSRSNEVVDVWAINGKDALLLSPSQRRIITNNCYRVVITDALLLLYVKRKY